LAATTTKKATATNGESPNGEAEAAVIDKVAPALRINRIQVETIRVPIVGTAPLISHRFDEKARKMMLEKQTARKRRGK
jgi:hypothetical protein